MCHWSTQIKIMCEDLSQFQPMEIGDWRSDSLFDTYKNIEQHNLLLILYSMFLVLESALWHTSRETMKDKSTCESLESVPMTPDTRSFASGSDKINPVKQRRACPTVQSTVCVLCVLFCDDLLNTTSLGYLSMFVFAEAFQTPNINTSYVLCYFLLFPLPDFFSLTFFDPFRSLSPSFFIFCVSV